MIQKSPMLINGLVTMDLKIKELGRHVPIWTGSVIGYSRQ